MMIQKYAHKFFDTLPFQKRGLKPLTWVEAVLISDSLWQLECAGSDKLLASRLFSSFSGMVPAGKQGGHCLWGSLVKRLLGWEVSWKVCEQTTLKYFRFHKNTACSCSLSLSLFSLSSPRAQAHECVWVRVRVWVRARVRTRICVLKVYND